MGQGLLIIEASLRQTHHTRQDFFGRGICPRRRPLPDNTQHSHETRHQCLRAGFETAFLESLRPRTHDLHSAVTGIATQKDIMNKITLFILESVKSSISTIKFNTANIWALQNCMRLSDLNTGGTIALL